MVPISEPSVVVYVLEWGLDSHYSTNTDCLRSVFTTIEMACSVALEYDNRPNIVEYDLQSHKTIKVYTDLDALDKYIGA